MPAFTTRRRKGSLKSPGAALVGAPKRRTLRGMDEKQRPWFSAIGFVLTLLAQAVAVWTGWYTATAMVGFAAFIYGWALYFIVGTVAITLLVIAIARRERVVLPILAIALLGLGGPASCTGAVALKGYCQRDPKTGEQTATNHCWR